MNLQELMAEWKAKYGKYIVRLEQLPDSSITPHRVKKNFIVWHNTDVNNSVVARRFSVWVLNPNTSNEVAYFDGSEPNIAPPIRTKVTFTNKINSKIQELINEGSIDSGIINISDDATKVAEVAVYMLKGNSLTKHIYRVKEESDGSLSFKEVTS